jgi:hypothetical protein
MKNIVYLFLSIIFISSCSEESPPGLDEKDKKVADSNYVAPLETKQDRVVLIEELTAVQCANCPQAATILKTMSDANPDRILTVGIHPSSSNLAEPIFEKSKYDFRVEDSDEIVSLLGGIIELPCASINREVLGSGLIFDKDKGTWSTRVTPLLAETTPVNITVNSSYQSDNNRGELVLKVAFTEEVSEELFVTAYIIENDIEDYQKDGSEKILYDHQHVFRDAITSISGSDLNFTDKTAGTVIQKRINFSPTIEGDNAWNIDNCKIIVFVHRSGDDKTILHAQKVSLK